MQRRSFIKSVVATSVLSLAGVSGYQYFLQSHRDYQYQLDTEFLSIDDQLLLSVLIPIFAAGMPSPIKIEVSLSNIDQTVLRLSQRTQRELRQLLDLLASGFGRVLVAGVWLDWQQSSGRNVEHFLTEWRSSHLELLQQGYLGLHQIIMGSLYAEPEHWPAIGYAKPFEKA
jgi:hypothetical protein